MGVDAAHARKLVALYSAVVLGAAWLIIALLARFDPGFVLFGAFSDLGFLFWIVFTVLGIALVASLAWASLSEREEAVEAALAATPPLDPVKLLPAWDPKTAPSEDRTACARCQRTLPPWRMPEGTCTVCAPFSVFLDKPRKPSPELEKRRNSLFVMQGLGLGLLALAFVSAVYLFPIVLTPQKPIIATLGFLVFSPLLFGLILVNYARSHAVPETDQ